MNSVERLFSTFPTTSTLITKRYEKQVFECLRTEGVRASAVSVIKRASDYFIVVELAHHAVEIWLKSDGSYDVKGERSNLARFDHAHVPKIINCILLSITELNKKIGGATRKKYMNRKRRQFTKRRR